MCIYEDAYHNTRQNLKKSKRLSVFKNVQLREIKAIFLQLKDRNFFRWVSHVKNILNKSHIFSLGTSDETSPSSNTNKCRQQMLMGLNHLRWNRNYTVPFLLVESCAVMLCKTIIPVRPLTHFSQLYFMGSLVTAIWDQQSYILYIETRSKLQQPRQ